MTTLSTPPSGTSAPPPDGRVPSTSRITHHSSDSFLRAASLADLQREGTLTVTLGPAGAAQTIALFWHQDRPYAVDNRCPHMGFPLAKGFCKDGILTCYWHYARFDLASGGTFDPWADDVRAFPTEVRDGAVWVDLRRATDSAAERARWTARLTEGLEQNVPLVQAKAILSLQDLAPSSLQEIVSTAASYALRFGSRRNPNGWGDGLTILTAMASLQEDLAPEERPLALYHGVRRAGEDAAGQNARVPLGPLPTQDVPPDQLKRWFRQFIEVRDAQAAERTLRTAIDSGWTPTQLIDLLAAAGTDHYYRDFSHVMDTLAHAADLLDLTGWDRAADVLPSLVPQWAAATREEEKNSWRHPEDLASMVADRIQQLPSILNTAPLKPALSPVSPDSSSVILSEAKDRSRGSGSLLPGPDAPPVIPSAARDQSRPSTSLPPGAQDIPVILSKQPSTREARAQGVSSYPKNPSAPSWVANPEGHWDQALIASLLGPNPEAALDSLLDALRGGLSIPDAAQALAYASALRLTRFPTSNEFGDWDTALHCFTYCASLAQVARRAPSAELARAILDGAMVVYQTRFLNVPAARLPTGRALDSLPADPQTLLQSLSDACEGQGGVDEAGALTYRYLTLGHEPAALIRQLGRVVLREDCSFHDFQMLEEGVRLAKDLLAHGTAYTQDAAFQTLVAIARWQAAHAPTRRAVTQTYTIALRLHRGEAVYEE